LRLNERRTKDLATNYVAPWKTVFLLELIDAKLIKKFQAFYETLALLSWLKLPNIGRYLDPNKSSSCILNLFL
jgi:hypothetical protein